LNFNRCLYRFYLRQSPLGYLLHSLSPFYPSPPSRISKQLRGISPSAPSLWATFDLPRFLSTSLGHRAKNSPSAFPDGSSFSPFLASLGVVFSFRLRFFWPSSFFQLQRLGALPCIPPFFYLSAFFRVGPANVPPSQKSMERCLPRVFWDYLGFPPSPFSSYFFPFCFSLSLYLHSM